MLAEPSWHSSTTTSWRSPVGSGRSSEKSKGRRTSWRRGAYCRETQRFPTQSCPRRCSMQLPPDIGGAFPATSLPAATWRRTGRACLTSAASTHGSAQERAGRRRGQRPRSSATATPATRSSTCPTRSWSTVRGGRRRLPAIRWRYGLGKGGFYAKHLRPTAGLRAQKSDTRRRQAPGSVPLAVWRRPRFAAGELTYAAGVSWASRGGRSRGDRD